MERTPGGLPYGASSGRLGSRQPPARKIMVVIKMRGATHSKDVRDYEITTQGAVIIGERLVLEFLSFGNNDAVHISRKRKAKDRSSPG